MRTALTLLFMAVHVAGSGQSTFHTQLPGLKVYTQLEGYPGRSGYMVGQDQVGFIWIGTDNGIARFDGHRFEVFDASDGLTDKEIIIVAPGEDSTVFFAPLLNNLAYCRKGKLVTAVQNPALQQVQNKYLNRVHVDKATDRIWLSDGESFGTLYCLVGDTLQKWEVSTPVPFSVNSVNEGLCFVKLYTTEEPAVTRLMIHDIQTGTSRQLVTDTGTELPGSHHVVWDSKGKRLVISSSDQRRLTLYRRSPDDVLQRIAALDAGQVIKEVILDKKDHLWLLFEEGGVAWYGSLDSGLEDRLPFVFLPEVHINYLFVDRNDHLWMTTRSEGLFFISSRHWNNALRTRNLYGGEGSPYMLAQDLSHMLWIGDRNQPGVRSIDSDGRESLLIHPSNMRGFRCIEPFPGGVALARGQELHIFYRDGPHGPKCRRITCSGTVKDLAYGNRSEWFVATHFQAEKWELAEDGNMSSSFLFTGRTTAISQLSDHSLVIGTPNGLHHFLPVGQDYVSTNDTVLKGSHVTDVAAVRDDLVLIGTSTQGLFSFSPGSRKVHQVFSGEQLEGAYIRQIYPSADATYWLATDQGVFHVGWDTSTSLSLLKHLTFYDGLPSNNTTSVQVIHDTVYAATDKGLALFTPADLGSPSGKPSEVFVRSVTVGEHQHDFPTHVRTTYPENDVIVSMNTISYESLGSVRFRYRLEGWSKRWMETEATEVNFSNLPPGTYRLWIEALNHQGAASEKALVFPVEVIPRFWQMGWFRACVLTILIGMLVAAVWISVERYRKKLRAELLQKRKLAELELEAIKAQINPHFISNCLNSVQYFHLKRDFECASEYLNLFTRLIHQTMQFSQETFITVREEVEYLKAYLELEKMRFRERLAFSIDVARDIPGSRLMPAMLVQPYVENALKHGLGPSREKGKVRISFASGEAGSLCISVEDNGVGFDRSVPKGEVSGLGLRLSGNRAAAYNQLFQMRIRVSICDRSTLSEATRGICVTLQIPPHSHAKATR